MDKGKPTDGESEKEIDILLKGTSRSFYLSLKVLPKKIRKQIGLGYILPRLSDTIADSRVGDNKILLKLLKQYNQRIQDKIASTRFLRFSSNTRRCCGSKITQRCSDTN